MALSAVLGFALIAVTLIVVPGPDWAFVLAAGVRDQVVVPAVAGLMAGYTAITAVVAVGIGPLVASSSHALLALTVCGAAYLVYLGVKTLRSQVDQSHLSGASGAHVPRHRYVIRGAGVSALNPKGLLVFLSILPQFTRTSAAWPEWLQLAALGLVFTLVCGAFYLLLGVLSDRVLSTRPAVAVATSKIAGAAMVLIGVLLVAERLLVPGH